MTALIRSNSRLKTTTCLHVMNLHVQCSLGLHCFLLAAIANQRAALGQAEMERQQGTVLHTDSPQSGTVNLHGNKGTTVAKR